MKNISFITGRMPPPFNVGGDGVSLHTYMKQMYLEGYQVTLLTQINSYFYPHYTSFKEVIRVLEEKRIPYLFDSKKKRLEYNFPYNIIMSDEGKLKELMLENSYDLLMTHLDFASKVVEYAIAKNVPFIYFIHDVQRSNYLVLDQLKGIDKNAYIVFNSNFIKDKYKSAELTVPNSVLYPPLSLHDYEIIAHEPIYISMINPVASKGGKIFYELAKHFSKMKFLAVKGWYDPKDDGIDLDRLENVTVLEKQDDIRKVFEQTRLLLAPSQEEEAFGRVVSEALTSEIPVIASNLGGLSEAGGKHATYVNNYTNIEEWIAILGKFISDPKPFETITSGAKEYVQRFNAKIEVQSLINIITSMI